MSRVIRSVGQGVFVFGTSRTQLISRLQAVTSARQYCACLSTTFDQQTSRYKPTSGSSIFARNLYSESSLGIDKLDRIQERKEQLFAGPTKERYIERLSKFVESGDTKSLFKDDLVNLIGIAENEQHLDLLERLVTSIEAEQGLLLQGWGTTLMRLYYKMNQLDRAVNNLKDVERFKDFFNQRGCYKIVMAMLFKAGKYREVIDVYHFADTRLAKREAGEHERYLSTLAFASLAKINNREALTEAEQLYNQIGVGEQQADRGVARSAQYLAFLAVNNDNPKLALNLISGFTGNLPIVMKDLKITSLMKLERYEDVLIQLRDYTVKIRRDMFILINGTVESIKRALDKIQDDNVRQELADILVEIKEGGHVTDATLEDLIFKEINEYQRQQMNNNFNNDQRDSFRQQRSSNYNNDQQYRPRPRFNNNAGQYGNNNERRYSNYNQQQRFNQDNANEGRDGANNTGRRFTYQKMDFSS